MSEQDPNNSPDRSEDAGQTPGEGSEAADVAAKSDGNESAPTQPPAEDALTSDNEQAQPDENISGSQLDDEAFKCAVEAVLFASNKPLSGRKLANVIEAGDARKVRSAVTQLQEEYSETGRAFQIEEIAGGYQMFTLPEYHPWVQRLGKAAKEDRLSQAALETLAIVAYRQPILRADIEAIRGVQCGPMLRALIEKGLVKVVGKSEELGRPLLYGTTRRFLELFGLRSLKDLPEAEGLIGNSEISKRASSSEESDDIETAEPDGSAPETESEQKPDSGQSPADPPT